MNFIGPAPGGSKWALINEQLIRSVHLFSVARSEPGEPPRVRPFSQGSTGKGAFPFE